MIKFKGKSNNKKVTVRMSKYDIRYKFNVEEIQNQIKISKSSINNWKYNLFKIDLESN